MALADFFDHTCNIFHLRNEEKSPGYGLPSSPKFAYPAEPDETEVACHFGVRTQNVSVTQTEPANMLDAKIKLTLPADADIRLNDKIVWLETGEEFTAEFPRDVRGHHKFVYLKRTTAQRPIR